jgi:hypothetical protein
LALEFFKRLKAQEPRTNGKKESVDPGLRPGKQQKSPPGNPERAFSSAVLSVATAG